MKTRTWAVLLGALLLLSVLLSLWALRPGEGAALAEISSQGQVLRTVDLSVDQEFTVTTPSGGENTVTVRDGKIAVTAASCPDHWCMDRGFQSGGREIVCLPNLLVIRFLGDTGVDSAVG